MNLLLFIPQQTYFQEAVDFAALLAEKTASALHLLHVSKSRRSHENSQKLLQDVSEILSPLQTASQDMAYGGVLAALQKSIDDHAIDLVIVASGKEAGIRVRPLETTINKIIARSPVPVIVVRKPAKKLDRILVCTGGTKRADDAIRAGADLAGQVGAQTTLLYVSNSVPSMYTGLGQMEESLQRILDTDTPLAHHLLEGAKTFEKYGLQGNLELRHGVPFEAILAAIEQDEMDMVIVGASRVGKNVRNWLLGNVSKQVLERSPVPVMIVHLGQSIS